MSFLLSPENSAILYKLFLALFLGMVIGTERIYAHKTAGMRTYALVSMGAALFVMIGEMVFSRYDPTIGANPFQLAGPIVTGIGFLGAGLIIFKDKKLTGLTTATSIWVSAGIGMAAGFGLATLAFIATILTLFIFIVLWFIEQRVKKIIPDAPDSE